MLSRRHANSKEESKINANKCIENYDVVHLKPMQHWCHLYFNKKMHKNIFKKCCRNKECRLKTAKKRICELEICQ